MKLVKRAGKTFISLSFEEWKKMAKQTDWFKENILEKKPMKGKDKDEEKDEGEDKKKDKKNCECKSEIKIRVASGKMSITRKAWEAIGKEAGYWEKIHDMAGRDTPLNEAEKHEGETKEETKQRVDQKSAIPVYSVP